MENNPIRTDIEVIEAAFAQFAVELCFVAAIELLNMQDEFVQIMGIIVNLSQLDLPGADLLNVVEHMLQFVEINQRAFDLVEIHLLDFGTARNISEQSWQRATAMRTCFVSQAAIN